ncbi:hypothetical protein ABB37_02990 [Leptomonas pyrrhocoris]|uniref:Uncharacterized protein n=1 Tax=Leptomonas pyrrhocoris TaxID=157538 RepID=A0A0N0DXS8_LEPPY|nr:hypothetical protein ABB37_02990 [Leptomonas pyrrhocoris]KPA83335.1 hypothetical protein ABB37_02990 [Leptomonas pyrrhocoris]|eukprot:XP_015661774.1 hypothetical protein ABB37_02990 [Leptomonas pyrrhocoris]
MIFTRCREEAKMALNATHTLAMRRLCVCDGTRCASRPQRAEEGLSRVRRAHLLLLMCVCVCVCPLPPHEVLWCDDVATWGCFETFVSFLYVTMYQNSPFLLLSSLALKSSTQ